LVFNQAKPPRHIYSAWPFLWVGAISTADGLGQGRNGEFCISVGPVIRTAGILA